jgi:FkbM family methyltransferase
MIISTAATASTPALPFDASPIWDDVDLIIPVGPHRFQVPAADHSLVPHLLAYRCWEPHLARYFARTLQPGHVFMDVGANFGYFTVLAAATVARVIAFEPSTRTHAYCVANIAMNRLTNVELHNCGLWHEDATVELTRDPSTLNAVIVPASDASAHESIRVITLDGLVDAGKLDLPRLDVVKLDVEGTELSALTGMRTTLARLRPAIVMEANPPMLARFGLTLADVWAFFEAMSYDLRVFAHWQERDPEPANTVDDLRRLCPADGLTDLVAVPAERASTWGASLQSAAQ